MQSVAVGSVIQFFRGVTSVAVVVNILGRDEVAEYAVVQAVAEGSVIQLFTADTSFVMEEHVVPSHLEVKTLGSVVDAAYTAVQEASVGSVIQLFNGDTSVAAAVRTLGKVVDAL